MNNLQIGLGVLGIALAVIGILMFAGYFQDYDTPIDWWGESGEINAQAYILNNTSSSNNVEVGLNETQITVLSTELTGVTGDDGWANFSSVDVGTYDVQATYNSSSIIAENVTIEDDQQLVVRFNFTDVYNYS